MHARAGLTKWSGLPPVATRARNTLTYVVLNLVRWACQNSLYVFHIRSLMWAFQPWWFFYIFLLFFFQFGQVKQKPILNWTAQCISLEKNIRALVKVNIMYYTYSLTNTFSCIMYFFFKFYLKCDLYCICPIFFNSFWVW